MSISINEESLFCDYYSEWISVYKEGAIREVTMGKYRLTQSWLAKLIPDLKIKDLDRTSYQQLINGYAEHHERQTTMDFHHQLKGAILDAVDEGLIPRDPTRKAIIKGKQPRAKKIKYLNQFELHAMLGDLDLSGGPSWDWLILIVAKTGLRFSEALGLTPDDFDFRSPDALGQQDLGLQDRRRFRSHEKRLVRAEGATRLATHHATVWAAQGPSARPSPYFAQGKALQLDSQRACLARHCRERWTCLSFPSTGCGIRTRRCCCSPASRSPACPAGSAMPA